MAIPCCNSRSWSMRACVQVCVVSLWACTYATCASVRPQSLTARAFVGAVYVHARLLFP